MRLADKKRGDTQNSVLEKVALEIGSSDWVYCCFKSIAALISLVPLDFPKYLYWVGAKVSSLRFSVSIEMSASSSAKSFGGVTLVLVPRIAEVRVSMEPSGDARKVG